MLIYGIVFKFYILIICEDVACQNRIGSTTVRSNGSIFELLRIKTLLCGEILQRSCNSTFSPK